jgi:TatD DNase family protein
MSIHSRNASAAVLEKLDTFKGAGVPVLHWFSGSFQDLERAKALNCWFSVGPAMLSGERGRKLVSKMPRNKVLTESDGPFAKVGNRSLCPWDVDIALRELSTIWSLPYEETQNIVKNNFQKLTSTDGHFKIMA